MEMTATKMAPFNLSDGDLVLQCMINSTSDPNCVCLLSGGGPQVCRLGLEKDGLTKVYDLKLNTDINGPGVRFSFYLQALFLALISVLSESVDEITGALYTLVVTNVAMVVTSFILGFQRQPEMSLHDAIVVFYLLTISWTTISFCLPAYIRFDKGDAALKIIYIIHSYMIFALVLAVLITAHTFGFTPRCNSHALVVIFKSFPALTAGRILAFISFGIVFVTFTLFTINDYGGFSRSRYGAFRRWLMKLKKDKVEVVEEIMMEGASRAAGGGGRWMSGVGRPKDRYNPPRVKGKLKLLLTTVTILWALSVMNTELLIVWNHFDGGSDGIGPSLWGFGQILPMFLVVLPFVNVIKALALQKPKHVKPVQMTHITIEIHAPCRAESDNPEQGRSRGPRPVPPRMPHNEQRREMPSFFQHASTANTHVVGSQPSAHISLNSIHTIPVESNVEDGNSRRLNSRLGLEHTRPSDSVWNSSSVSSRTNGYATAEEGDV